MRIGRVPSLDLLVRAPTTSVYECRVRERLGVMMVVGACSKMSLLDPCIGLSGSGSLATGVQECAS